MTDDAAPRPKPPRGPRSEALIEQAQVTEVEVVTSGKSLHANVDPVEGMTGVMLPLTKSKELPLCIACGERLLWIRPDVDPDCGSPLCQCPRCGVKAADPRELEAMA